MRVLYHHRTQGEEPESIHIAAIVGALRALGHEVRVVGPAPLRTDAARPRPSLLGKLKKMAPGLLFELMQLAYNLVVDRRVAKAIDEFQPDLVYERYALFNFAGVRRARQRGVPLILEVNTPYAQAWAMYFGLHLQRLARWLERRTWAAASHIVTVTEVQRAMLVREGIAAQHISVCHNAIDPDWFSPQRQHVPQLPAGVVLAAPVVGFVGTMNRWQGMPAFTAVLRSVLARRAQVSFLFVGDGEFRRVLEGFCQEQGYAGRVVFTGRKAHAEIAPLLALMDIAVLLDSNAYGSPMKIFEYMGMAKAIIAPRVGPVMEVLRDGQTGLLIDAGDAGQMADQIVRLVDDPALRRRLGSAGREYVTAHHTWRQNALKIEQIYARIGSPRRTDTTADTC